MVIVPEEDIVKTYKSNPPPIKTMIMVTEINVVSVTTPLREMAPEGENERLATAATRKETRYQMS